MLSGWAGVETQNLWSGLGSSREQVCDALELDCWTTGSGHGPTGDRFEAHKSNATKGEVLVDVDFCNVRLMTKL